MCDTMVALSNSTKNKQVILAKNSDREPDEPAEVLHIPRQTHDKGSEIRATYISIPQVHETAEVLLCKPIWIWGAEMGANEFGVAIGNEAVYTKEKYNKKGGLLGMDLLRLGLERGKTAKEAFEVIVDLLELYDQGGNYGYRKKTFYHNSYLIADKKEAWVLETAGKYWIGEKVKDIRSISNTVTIKGKGDIRHPELIEHAIDKGWCRDEDDFDFYAHYRKKLKKEQIFAMGMKRCSRSEMLLRKNKGKIDEKTMMDILRDHVPEKDDWSPVKDASLKSLCVHAKNIFNPSQSTISMISVLDKNIQTHWITGTSAPCTSVFKPFFLPNAVPKLEFKTTAYYESKNLWWQHEKLHRLVLLDYQKRLGLYKKDRDEAESKIRKDVQEILKKAFLENDTKKKNELLAEFTNNKIIEIQKLTDEWISKIETATIESKPSRSYLNYWAKKNNWNKLNI